MTAEGFTFNEEAGGIQSWTLDANGLNVLLCPQGEVPVATFMITYNVGSRDEGSGETGATHFLEHMMFKGTEKYSKKSGTTVFNVLQARGARVNATTWNDRTNYYELLPSEHLGLAIDLEADRMRGLSLDPEEVASEKSVILNEFDRGENQPFRKLYHALYTAAFDVHPYRHPTIGWRQDIEQVTPEGLRSFYDRYYWPPNATVSVIGGFDQDAVLKDIHEAFGGIERGPVIQRPEVDDPRQLGERRTIVRMAGGTPALILAHKSPRALDSDWTALQMASMVLAVGRTSRLQRLLVNTGIATSVSASADAFRDPGLFSVFVSLAAEDKIDEAEKTLVDALIDLAENGVEQEELDRAVAKLRAQTLFARDGSFSMASQLNESIAAGDWRLYVDFLDRAAQVTPSDVERVMTDLIDINTRTVATYLPS